MASKATPAAILFERAQEKLRQEREVFDQRKNHAQMWFYLQLAMGIVAICMLVAITVITAYVLLNPATYSVATVTACSIALLTDVLGLLIGVWKIVLNPPVVTRLTPATEIDMDEVTEIGREKPEPRVIMHSSNTGIGDGANIGMSRSTPEVETDHIAPSE